MKNNIIWSSFKAGLAYTLSMWLVGVIISILGYGGLIAIMSAPGSGILAVGIIALLIAVPLMFIVSGYVQYHIVKWAFKK